MFFIIINIYCNLNYLNVFLLLICYINNELFEFSVVFNQNCNLKKLIYVLLTAMALII